MGGYGSGWPYWKGKKTTVDECREIDALRLYQEGLLAWDQTWSGRWQWSDAETGEVKSTATLRIDTRDRDNPWMRISYRFTKGTAEGEELTYTVRLTTTPLHFGGEYWWMHCPGEGCGRRVRKLYLPPRGTIFACRRCYDLTYRSCQESDKRLSRLLDRFGGDPLALLDAANRGEVDLVLALKATEDLWN